MKQDGLFDDGTHPRAALQARWYALTRHLLPAMAQAQGWPIHLDHCFMRVCLDMALGTPWTLTVRRPAMRHMTDTQLAAAVAVAEDVLAHPATLADLNSRSLAGRQAARGR